MMMFESKINIFEEEMRYFLIFYINSGFIVHWALEHLTWVTPPHQNSVRYIRGFPKLNLSRIELIELIWMILGILNINSCVTSKLPIINKILPCDNRISCRYILLYIVNKQQCNVFTIRSFSNNLLTFIEYRTRIGLVTEVFILNYQSLFFFQFNSIMSIESE